MGLGHDLSCSLSTDIMGHASPYYIMDIIWYKIATTMDIYKVGWNDFSLALDQQVALLCTHIQGTPRTILTIALTELHEFFQ